MKRSMLFVSALCTLAALIAATAGASSPVSYGPTGGKVTVTKGHFEYDLFDQTNQMTFHFSCDEQRLENSHGIRETIHCKTNDRTHSSAIIFSSPANLFGGLYYWSSDFTGEVSKEFHLVGTPSGNLDGWATY